MGESEERARRIGSVITCISIYKKKKGKVFEEATWYLLFVCNADGDVLLYI